MQGNFGANLRAFRRQKTSSKVFDLALLTLMVLMLIITLFPFLNVLAISFNESSDTVKGGVGLIPRQFTFDNYLELARYPALFTGFYISVSRTLLGTVVSVFFTSMLAYTISRRDYRFRRFVTVIFLLTMYVSGGLIPEFMVIRMFGLNNSFWVYIIPGLVGAYNLIIMRSFIDNIPYSLQESAHIDGASDYTIFFRIILPLCKPALATIALYVAVGHWNSWFDTYLYAPFNESITTLQYELMKILQGSISSSSSSILRGQAAQMQLARSISPLSIRMAITVVTIVPIVIVYPFLQKYFVTGMTLGAVKS